MNTFQIETCLKNNRDTEKIFCGVYAADKIPSVHQIKKPLLIVNTDSSHHSGTHWIVFFIRKKDARNTQIEIFDSSGEIKMMKNKYFKRYFQINFPLQHIKINTNCVQSYTSNLCGIYCIVFALYKARKKSFDYFLKLFHPKNLRENDRKVVKIFKKYFKSSNVIKELNEDNALQTSKSLILYSLLKNNKMLEK